MLVLSRKLFEKIYIGEKLEICITILEVRGSVVRLGVEAPRSIPVYRQELLKEGEGNDPSRADSHGNEG